MNRIILFFVTSLFSVQMGFSDGIYIPEKAYKLPDITAQRAIISFKDGTETVIISSTLDSKSQELGWIIPLPKNPDLVEKANAGLLDAIAHASQPKIIHDLNDEISGAIALAIFLCLMIILVSEKRKSPALYLVLLLNLFLLSGLLMPSLGTVQQTQVFEDSKVTQLQKLEVGSYTISIIEASDHFGLNKWLSNNSMKDLPEKGKDIVNEYIKDKWCFAAIRLRRSLKGENTPHPIKIRFKISQPVYPMRLTSLSNSSPKFEIYVISNSRVKHPYLEAEYCDQFEYLESKDVSYDHWGSSYESKQIRGAVGADVFSDLFWDDAVLTRLVGHLDTKQMSKDMYFENTTFSPYQKLYYSSEGVYGTITVQLIYIGVFTFFLWGVCRRFVKIKRKIAVYKPYPAIVIILLFLSPFLYSLTLESLDESKVKIEKRFYPTPELFLQRVFLSILIENRRTENDLEKKLLQEVKNQYPRNSSHIKIGKQPHGFEITKTGDALSLRIYDGGMVPHVIKRNIAK